jgi:hypothetical protein
VVVDARITRSGSECVMRHFLTLSLSIIMLAPGVLPATGKLLLEAFPRRARAVTTSRTSARFAAVTLPMVAALAQTQLLAAPGAIEDSVPGFDDGSTSSSQKPGQCPSIASLSVWDKHYPTMDGHFPEGSRRLPRAFTFFRARLLYRAPQPRETQRRCRREPGAATAPTSTRRNGIKNQIHEEDGSQELACHW